MGDRNTQLAGMLRHAIMAEIYHGEFSATDPASILVTGLQVDDGVWIGLFLIIDFHASLNHQFARLAFTGN